MTAAPTPIAGVVRGIAIRRGQGLPMLLLEQTEIVADRGLMQDARASRDRGVTMISARQWDEVASELNTELPWHTRRANLLIDGPNSMAAWAGRIVEIGPVRLLITGETRPCAEMDRQFAGLRAALVSDWRGGVTARVLAGGRISIGDALQEGRK